MLSNLTFKLVPNRYSGEVGTSFVKGSNFSYDIVPNHVCHSQEYQTFLQVFFENCRLKYLHNKVPFCPLNSFSQSTFFTIKSVYFWYFWYFKYIWVLPNFIDKFCQIFINFFSYFFIPFYKDSQNIWDKL